MILYLIKSVTCSVILFAIYSLWLEREKMYTFNRFYLLFSLCFAICIPFFKIDIVPQVSPVILFDEIAFHQNTTLSSDTTSAETAFLPMLMLIVYSLVTLTLSYRFTRNLLRIRSSVINNKTINYKNAVLVLLNEQVPPHSFLRWIFLHREDYRHQRIEKELLAHELTHVKQKHSLDILFVELLQILLWFNPLLYLYKKAIKINHEYLADESVIKLYQNITTYQQLLLKNISQNTYSLLASYSNYALAKKRLIMMTKSKSPTRVLLKKVTLVPVFVVIALAFSTKLLAQESNEHKEAPHEETAMNAEKDSITRVKENYYKSSSGSFGFKNEDGKWIYKTYDELTPEEKDRLAPPPLPEKKLPTQEQLDAWLDPIMYGVWIDGSRIENSILNNYKPSDFADYTVSRLMKNAKNYDEHEFQVNISTQEYFEAYSQRMLKRLGISGE